MIGQKVKFEGLEYEVIEFGPRDKLAPLPGVRLIGNALVIQDAQGNKTLIYEWDLDE